MPNTPQLHTFTSDQPAGFIINPIAGESYNDNVVVFSNGVKLQPIVDYTLTTGSITFICSFLQDDVISVNPLVTVDESITNIAEPTSIIVENTTTTVNVTNEPISVTSNTDPTSITVDNSPITVTTTNEATNVTVENSPTNINVETNPINVSLSDDDAVGLLMQRINDLTARVEQLESP